MSVSLQWRLLAVIGMAAAFFALVTSFIYYSVQRNHYLNGVDAKLTTGATLARLHVGANFHDDLHAFDSLDPARYNAIVSHFNAASVEAGFQYLWSNLVLSDGSVVFTTATSPGKKLSDADHAPFFSVHSDPAAFAAVIQSERPTFTTFRNEWGQGRMVLLPYRDAHDRLYVFGASMDIEPIERFLVGQLGWALIMFIGLLLISSVIAARLSRSLTRPLRQLQRTAEAIAHGDYATPKAQGGGVEIEALSNSVELMRQTIQTSLRNIQESEARFKSLFDQSPVSILLHDKDTGAIIDANEPAWRAYGVDSLEALKRLDIWLESPFSRVEALAHIQDALKSGAKSLVWKIASQQGGFFWKQVMLRPIILNDVQCVLSVAIDITDRKKLEDLLSREKRLLHTLISTLPDLVWLKNSEGVYLACNKRFEQFFGASEADILGKTDYDFMCTAQADFFRQHDQLAIAKGVPSINEEDIVFASDGHHETLETIKAPLCDEDGRLHGVLGIGRDITERKQAQMELEQHRKHLSELVDVRTAELELAKEAAEAASRAKSVFLASMSHEIRTPLNAVIGFAQILRHDSALNAHQLEQVETIARAGQHLLGLINDILELSKIESGRIPLKNADYNLCTLLHDLRDLFALKAAAKGVSLELICEPDVPVHVHGDEGKLRQVLINLLGNAVKFTQAGQVRLAVRLASASVDYSGADSRRVVLAFDIQDTGPGMTGAELALLFQPFQQTIAGQKSGGGTGLGLNISQKLVLLMGGEIEVHSVVDEGSCFSFRIPLERASAAENLPPEPERLPVCWQLPAGTAVPCLLLVDDILDNCRLLVDLLKPLGFKLVEAHDGAEAVAIFESQPIDLVLMDMRMPVMDGYEATRRIKVMAPQTPVVAVSASSLQDDQRLILDCGVDAFISKPVDQGALLRTIWRLLGWSEPMAGPDCERAGQEVWPEDQAVSVLPAALRSAMREALSLGDMETFDQLLALGEADAPVVVMRLRVLAREFDYDSLQALLADNSEKGKQ